MENTLAVIFDVDGTMVNNGAFHKNAWMVLTARYGMPLTERDYLEKIHARSNDRIIRGLFGDDTPAATIQRIADEKEELYRSSFAPHLREIPGLTRLLEELRRLGIPCGAVSNSPKANVDFVLDGLGIRNFFRVVIDREMLKVGKPDPEGLLRVAGELGYTPEQCLVFEDSSSGFKACRNAGMRYIAIMAETEPEELKEAYDAIALLPDFTGMQTAKLAAYMQ